MAYDPSEIKGLIEDVWQPFRDLDAIETELKQIEAGTYAWEGVIPAELGDPVPASLRMLTEIVSYMDQAISIPIRPVVNLSKSGTEADKERDALEMFFDYARFRMDTDGYHRQTQRSDTIRSRFGVNVLSINPYQPDGTDEYEDKYWRWRLHSPDPASIGVLRNDAGKLTVGVLKEEIPYLDMAHYLSGRNEKEPAKDFLARKFGTLKLGDGSSPWSDQAFERERMKKITRCIVYTDEDICQYIEVGRGYGEQSNASWAQIEESEPNPFGQVPIVLFPGIFRPHSSIKEQYEGLMWAPASPVRNLILMYSIALTIYGNQRLVDQLDPDIARSLLERLDGPDSGQLQQAIRNLIQPQVDAKGQKGTSLAFGSVVDMSRQLDAAFGTAMQGFREDLEFLRQAWMSIFPSPDTVESSTAAGLLAGIEQGERRAEKALATQIAGERQILEMIAYDTAQTYKRPVGFRMSGSEFSGYMPDGFESGTEREITPDMMQQFVDGSAWIGLEPVPSTNAQRAAAVRQEIEIQTAVGVKNSKRLYEAAGESNVSARMEEDAALTNAAYLGPGAAQFAMQDVIQEFALEQERDAALISQLWVPQFGGGQGGGGPQTAEGGGYQYRSPEIPMANGANASTAPGIGV